MSTTGAGTEHGWRNTLERELTQLAGNIFEPFLSWLVDRGHVGKCRFAYDVHVALMTGLGLRDRVHFMMFLIYAKRYFTTSIVFAATL